MTASAPLTSRQREWLAAIVRLTAAQGYAPSVRELGREMGASSANGVHDVITALKRKGAVTWVPGRQRTLRVISAEQLSTNKGKSPTGQAQPLSRSADGERRAELTDEGVEVAPAAGTVTLPKPRANKPGTDASRASGAPGRAGESRSRDSRERPAPIRKRMTIVLVGDDGTERGAE